MLKEHTLPPNSYHNFVGNSKNLRMLGYQSGSQPVSPLAPKQDADILLREQWRTLGKLFSAPEGEAPFPDDVL